MTDFLTVYVTVSSKAEAQSISRGLLEERLCACTNFIPGIESTYHWQGAIETSEEAVLLIKTSKALYERVQAKVSELHSYDCPCIVAWPIEQGSPKYLEWLKAEML